MNSRVHILNDVDIRSDQVTRFQDANSLCCTLSGARICAAVDQSSENLSLAANLKIELIAELLESKRHQVEILSQGEVGDGVSRFILPAMRRPDFTPRFPSITVQRCQSGSCRAPGQRGRCVQPLAKKAS